jgi:hypothetical protein
VLGEPEPIDVEREIAALRAEVAAIRSQWREGWQDEARAAEVRGIVRDALADSSTRASFRGDGWSTGYDRGFFVRSADGCWSVRLNIMAQTRFVAAAASGPGGTAAIDQTRWGFETRRLNIGLGGTIVDPSLSYEFLFSDQSQTDRFISVPNTLRPLYAWVCKDFGHGWSATVGLQNVPWDIESTMFGSSRLMTGDYSIFNYRFGVGKQPGASVRHRNDSVRTVAGIYTQAGDLTLGWDDPANLSFVFATRTEVKWGADWSELEVESSAPGDVPGFIAGLGFMWSGARGTNPQPPTSTLATPAAAGFTADARAVLGGTTLIGQFALMRDAVGSPELGWTCGANAQASAYLTTQLEAFAEGSWTDDVPVPWIAQAGVNLHLDPRVLKLTCKVIVPFGPGDVNGIRAIAGGLGIAQADNDASFVAQLQVNY